MKSLKLSKTAWLILSAGVFLVILAGLGLTRTQQLGDLSASSDELEIATMRLASLDVTDLRNRVEELQEKITLGKADLRDAVNRLDKSVISADVAEDFYDLAGENGVFVDLFTSTAISSDTLEGIPVSQTGVTARVQGTLAQVVDFIINVNTSFRTGYIRSAELHLALPDDPEIDADALTNATIQMIIYSYQEEE
jgi:hypothetical protein